MSCPLFTAVPGKFTPSALVQRRAGRQGAITLAACALALLLSLARIAPAQSCTNDINGDGSVDGFDLAAVLAQWGTCASGSSCSADLNADGTVNGVDLASLLAGWGTCVTVPSWATLLEARPDPALVHDAALREAISATGYAWRVRDTATQIEMVLIPPGTFLMGCTASIQHSCNPSFCSFVQRQVTLTQAFYLGRHEVTQAQWAATMGVNPSFFVTANGYPGSDSRPVERVSSSDVLEFCALTGMRLPTEAEWEYSYRAGTVTPYHSMPGFPSGTDDDTQLDAISWNIGNNGPEGSLSYGTKPVGLKAPNGFGLHDMAGNVFEWVNDWFSVQCDTEQVDPVGPVTRYANTSRRQRGGYWGSGLTSFPHTAWAGAYFNINPEPRIYNLGFRVARDPVALPRVTAVEPAIGSPAGGTMITLTGTKLSAVTTVTVGGIPCTNVNVVSDTTVTAVTPAGAIGAAAVRVIPASPGSFGVFSYASHAPTAIVPTYGSAAGGTTITITGTNLAGTTAVTVGGALCTGVNVVSDTTVTAVTPAGDAGARDVTITGVLGSVTMAGAFTYYAGGSVPSWAALLEPFPPEDVVFDQAHRDAIIATGLAWRVRDSATNIEMVLIPPGTFSMGCSASVAFGCTTGESPVHQVTLTQPLYVGRYEVTQAQWQARVGWNPSAFQNESAQVPLSQVPSRPVEGVSWDMVQGFLSGTGLRLPTEAEWEYAYRAGTTTAFHGYTGSVAGTNSDSVLLQIAWFSSNSSNQTRPVGGRLGNGFGLHDMAGNVAEWVSDWWANDYYAWSPSVDPQGPSSGTGRVNRGGSYSSQTGTCRASSRGTFPPSNGWSFVGFRVARNP